MFIGHQKQWRLLRNSFEKEKLPHALLFCGQEKIGKKKVAIELAKFINCLEKEKPCGSCRNCLDIERGLFPDFVLIRPSKKQAKIQIAEVRNTIKKLSLKPYSSPLRIAVIDQAHLMTADAQGCFLKFLEEPKGDSLIILITEYPEILLPTIRSRIQKIRFHPLPASEIKERLQKEGAGEKEAETLSLVCGGKTGVALDLLERPDILEKRKSFIKDLVSLNGADMAVKFNYAKNLFKNSESGLQEILDAWLSYLRRSLLAQIFGEQKRSPLKYSLAELKEIILLTQKTRLLISTTNVSPRLAFEVLLLQI